MSMIEVGHALRPSRSLWRTLIFSLAVIGTILVGLLAMHSFNIEGGHSGHSASSSAAASADHHVVSADTHDATAATPLAGLAECDGDCEHTMTLMACIMALMVSMIVLGSSRATVIETGITRVISSVVEPRGTLAPAVPPSLHVLSISRT